MSPALRWDLPSGYPPDIGGYFNSGGPRSRTRTERLYSSVLGASDGHLRSPCVRRVGLCFGECDPVETAYRLLAAQGFADPEELRACFEVPPAPLLCRADAAPTPLAVAAANPRDVLEDALWLGLATPWLLDPARPVLWTRASLTRCLEVFEGEGFYA